MCMQCIASAMTAGAAKTGIRAWVATHNPRWMTARSLKLTSAALLTVGVLASGSHLAPNGGTAVAKDRPAPWPPRINKNGSHSCMLRGPCSSPFQLPFVQRGLAEVLLLSVSRRACSARGSSCAASPSSPTRSAPPPSRGSCWPTGWASRRRWAHSARRSSSRWACGRSRRRPGSRYDSLTAIVLAGCLAVGVILASDVFRSGRQHRDPALRQPARDRPRRPRCRRRSPSALVLARPSCSARGGWRRGSIPTALGPSACAPGFSISSSWAWSRSRRSRPSPAVGALLVAALIVVPAATVRLWTAEALPGRSAAWPSSPLEGTAASGSRSRPNAPPGADDRRDLRRRSSRSPRRPGGSRPRACAWPARVRRSSPLLALAAGCGGSARRLGRAQGRRDHHPARRLRPGGRRGPRGPPLRSSSPTPTRTSTSRAPATCARRPARRWSSPAATTSTRGWRRWSPTAGGSADAWSISAPPCRSSSPASPVAPEASRYDPHWWHDPVNVETAIGTIAASAHRGRSRRSRAGSRRTPGPTCAKLSTLDSGIAACFGRRAARAAQARDRPRRLRLLRQPLRHRGGRSGHPLADHRRLSPRPGTWRPRRR